MLLRTLGLSIGLLLLVPPAAANAAPEGVCAAEPGADTTLPTLKLVKVNDREVVANPRLDFKDRRKSKSISFEYEVEGCVFPTQLVGESVDVQFLAPRTESGDALNAGIKGGMQVKRPDVVAATYAVDPANDVNDVVPGSYIGGFVVTDPRFASYREDVEITASYGDRTLLFITLILPALILGPFLVWYKGRAGGSRESYWRWWVKLLNIVAVGGGLAAAVVYFHTNVVDKLDFGADLVDRSPFAWFMVKEWWTAALALGGAFTSAVLTASAVGDAKRGGAAAPSDQMVNAGRLPTG